MNKPEWVYCRNCVAWRDSSVVATIVAPDGSTAKEMTLGRCRRRCDTDDDRSGDDGCCEGVPKVARGAK